MLYIFSIGGIILFGAIGYSLGEYYGGPMGVKLGTMAGVVFGVLIVAALNTKSLSL